MSKQSDLFGELPFRDYLEVARRRWLIIALTATAIFLLVAVVAFRLPNVYRSETVILVDPQKVPDNYVASTVTSSIGDRLSTIQQEVMSPTRLKRLIDQMGLFASERKVNEDQALIARMQRAITVEVVTQGGRQLSAFRVSYRGQNPVEVAHVTNQLAAMFIEENLKSREQQSFGTAEFLDNELQKTKAELEAKENQLSTIKSRYILDLPESKQYHLEALTTLRTQADNIQSRIQQAQQEKVYLQSLAVTTQPTIDLDSGMGVAGANPYEAQLQRIETRLSELKSRYGPNHPDVRKVSAQAEDLRKKAQAAEQDAPPQIVAPAVRPKIKNPVLEAQIQKLEEEIADQKKLLPKLQEQINFHVNKLERVPLFEQQIAGLMRDYDSLKTHYTSLTDKKLSAQMASNLENRQKGERFVILDPAQIPQAPAAPNRLLLVFGGLVAALAAGVGLAALLEVMDGTVRNEQEAGKLIGQVLATVPDITSRGTRVRYRIRVVASLAATIVISLASGYGLSEIAVKWF